MKHARTKAPFSQPLFLAVALCAPAGTGAGAEANSTPKPGAASGGLLQYRVGFLGVPSSVDTNWVCPVPWNAENLSRLKALGFNTVQLNVAWGSRPGDEPLNLEDVVDLSPQEQRELPQPVPLRSHPSPERRQQRQAELRQRLALCRQAGFRTLFHFGAPYNAHGRYGGTPPNCILDPLVAQRHLRLLAAFARQFPGVDDLLVYTYDQDAWLCSEFERCPRCRGVALHQRLAPFLEQLAAAWRGWRPEGRLWWEPWELSAGQVLACVEAINPQGLGLALHCNIAECQATLPVDRWFRNTCAIAQRRGIPVIGEYFLGGPSEELEPLASLSHPLVTWRGLEALTRVPGVVGIKEYYGLAPDREDPNLRMSALFFHQPQIGEEEALRQLAQPYGPAAQGMTRFWRLTSAAMELFPWETSWHIRELGRSDPAHSLSAATLHGEMVGTPSWAATRHGSFMKVDNAQPDPWMLEDVQLRCELAAASMAQALTLGNALQGQVPADLAQQFRLNLVDLGKFRRRALAYAYHLRESNLATVMRNYGKENQPVPKPLTGQLLALMRADYDNYRADQLAITTVTAPSDLLARAPAWPEMETAIAWLEETLSSQPDAGEALDPAWIWYPEANPAAPAPVGTRYFRRSFELPTERSLQSALLIVAADNEFTLWVNGQKAGVGAGFAPATLVDLAQGLKAGRNTLALEVRNLGATPNPAGLIATVRVAFKAGPPLLLATDRTWQAQDAAPQGWPAPGLDEGAWKAATVVGPAGCAPWGPVLVTIGGPVEKFLQVFFQEGPVRNSKGLFSVTSR